MFENYQHPERYVLETRQKHSRRASQRGVPDSLRAPIASEQDNEEHFRHSFVFILTYNFMIYFEHMPAALSSGRVLAHLC